MFTEALAKACTSLRCCIREERERGRGRERERERGREEKWGS